VKFVDVIPFGATRGAHCVVAVGVSHFHEECMDAD